MQEMALFSEATDSGDVPVIAACDVDSGRLLALCLQNHPEEENFRKSYGFCNIKLMTIAEAFDQMDSEPRLS